MKVHHLKREIILPMSLEEAWDFFSSPRNLEELTPPDLSFRITHLPSEKMYSGEIITYKIMVAPAIWLGWVTEIKAVEDRKQFVDEQRSGPYRFWHHLHTFEEVEGGVKVGDLVHYSLGWGLFGEIAHSLFVKKKLAGIFDFREKVMREKWGSSPTAQREADE